MRTAVSGKERNTAAANKAVAPVSVVVLSSGSPLVAQQATDAIVKVARSLSAQVILVAQHKDPLFVSHVERTGTEFVEAPAGSTRAEMCDLGMSRVRGNIVAVRDDVAVGDAGWLNTYCMALPQRAGASPSPESLVMDTLEVGRVPVADSAGAFGSSEAEANAAAGFAS